LGGEFGVRWDDGDPLPGRHVSKDSREQLHGPSRYDKLVTVFLDTEPDLAGPVRVPRQVRRDMFQRSICSDDVVLTWLDWIKQHNGHATLPAQRIIRNRCSKRNVSPAR